MDLKENSKEMISVIIPVYNAQQYLPQCLNSILNQTYRNLEIILVDDGSNDNSLQICQEFAKQDKRIRVFAQKNKGSTRARRAGLHMATGEYISFIDSDDWIEPCFYKNLYTLIKKNRADMIVSGCVIEEKQKSDFKKNNFPEGFYDKDSLKTYVYPQMLYYESMDFFEFGIQQYLWNKLYKKSLIAPCLERLDDRIHNGEDVACIFDACLHADSIVVDNHCWYHYRIRENSICTSKRDERYFVNAVYLYQYMENCFRNFKEYSVLLPQLKQFMNMFINNGTWDIFGYGYVKSDLELVWKLPCIAEKEKCKVALFGAGDVGRSYHHELLQIENIVLVVWVDSHISGNKIDGVIIEKPKALLENSWDYVFVAVKDREKSNEITAWLKEQGIKDEKIWNEEPRRVSRSYKLEGK